MITALRGMKDIIENGEIYKEIIEICEDVARKFGYSYIETPKLEATALFRRSVGESSDIVNKEMYEFSDKSGNSVCLRPEGTAGVVRAFIEAKMDRAGGIRRWFYHGSMFRYERPQKGRLREFHQFGVECFGVGSVYEDASVLLIANEILQRLGISANLKINSLGDSQCMPIYKEKLVKFLQSCDLCEDCRRRIATNPIRVLDCKNEKCQLQLKNAPAITDHLNEECARDFGELQRILRENGVKFEIDPKLVRGLDYYCKTAFEFVSGEIGAQSAVCGGGRYDKLVEFLGGKPTFGVGFALGIERIMEILANREEKPARKGIYFCALDEANLPLVYNLSVNLRKNNDVFVSYEAKNLQKHLKSADAQNALIFMCIGENEAKSGEIWCKNLAEKSEKTIKFDDVKGKI